MIIRVVDSYPFLLLEFKGTDVIWMAHVTQHLVNHTNSSLDVDLASQKKHPIMEKTNRNLGVQWFKRLSKPAM